MLSLFFLGVGFINRVYVGCRVKGSRCRVTAPRRGRLQVCGAPRPLVGRGR